jgi:hypothetical protein
VLDARKEVGVEIYADETKSLDQWFPNGVSRHPGVSGGTTMCVAKLKKKIFKLRLMMIINN